MGKFFNRKAVNHGWPACKIPENSNGSGCFTGLCYACIKCDTDSYKKE